MDAALAADDTAAVRWFLVILAACGAPQHRRPLDGAIAGLARDHDSGDPVAKAEIRIRARGELAPLETISTREGIYGVDHLRPGRYSLTALFAGQPVEVENIDVVAGETSIVDLVFTLGQPDPIHVSFGDPKEGEIDRYRPSRHARESALIEGTVNDAGSHIRVAGAVVTAARGTDVLQAVSDDQGRYRFDPVPPGTYVISAYYSIGGRGQIEVRRSGIRVDGAEGVIVPLWVELAKQ